GGSRHTPTKAVPDEVNLEVGPPGAYLGHQWAEAHAAHGSGTLLHAVVGREVREAASGAEDPAKDILQARRATNGRAGPEPGADRSAATAAGRRRSDHRFGQVLEQLQRVPLEERVGAVIGMSGGGIDHPAERLHELPAG